MLGLFKEKKNYLVAPVSGTCIPVERVNDKVFSAKMLGDGFAVIPDGHTVVAPVSGELATLFPTGHAFGIKTKAGIEVLVHIGIDTVNLEGKGFSTKKKQGDKVKAGDPVVEFDPEIMKENGLDMTVITVFTAGFDKEISIEKYDQKVESNETLMEL